MEADEGRHLLGVEVLNRRSRPQRRFSTNSMVDSDAAEGSVAWGLGRNIPNMPILPCDLGTNGTLCYLFVFVFTHPSKIHSCTLQLQLQIFQNVNKME